MSSPRRGNDVSPSVRPVASSQQPVAQAQTQEHDALHPVRVGKKCKSAIAVG
eukprot:CAMPEP_0195006646 /NCGR_PEP_ID=MMETSP0326_2-20130528/6890_1 /TAXON_ID=2866 ORGANISM="Crypthecodinium cohnii, Strain Seligo" /NCGR_SAMPLE_ID=MMETSP0326_2 /ASSEMBLY_ACC=CAM_ASM_000348 /LENGTH=51 /DNA_ID=CAMNT_0040013517 /DNA_START=200 /DNA_END=352 /DNA_ORIENTATION=+